MESFHLFKVKTTFYIKRKLGSPLWSYMIVWFSLVASISIYGYPFYINSQFQPWMYDCDMGLHQLYI